MRPGFKILLSIFAVILLLPFLLNYRQFAFFSALTLGWFSFLQRTLPKLTWNWDIIGMALLSVVLILFLAQKFLNGLSKNIASKRGSSWIWPWKWTWSLLVAVLLLFLVGMAVGGATHQIGWIASNPESLFVRKSFSAHQMATSNMRELELAFRLALDDGKGKLDDVRKELWNAKSEYFSRYVGSPPMLQSYHLLVVLDERKNVLGTIILPRDPKLREQTGAICSFEEGDNYNARAKKLSDLLQKYQARLIAL